VFKIKFDSFKPALCPFIRNILTNICPLDKSQLERDYALLELDLKDINAQMTAKDKVLLDTTIALDEAVREIIFYKSENYRLSYSSPMEQYWNEKRPYADVKYSGRYLPFTTKKVSIPVQLYVTPNDSNIRSDIELNGLSVKDPSYCDEDIIKIYQYTRTKPSNPYRYVNELENVGVPELWFFPFELRIVKKGDCDDWGNELASYLIAAGVPRYRVRVVVGNTWGGGGHCTVYVLADNLRNWHHINSTTGIFQILGKELKDFPKSNDSEDAIGIKDVWFSYNDKYAWNEFESESAEKEFKKTIKNVIINGGK